MKITIRTEREVSTSFLSDVMVTAFDGQYGGAWSWFEPVPGVPWPIKDDHDHWMEVHVRVRKDEPTGEPLFDRQDGFKITHASVAQGLSRIINRDYLQGTEAETAEGLRENIMNAVYEADAGMIDAYDASAIIQAAAFGKVIFG